MSRIGHRTSGRGFELRAGFEQGGEFIFQNAATERKKFGDENVWPDGFKMSSRRVAAVRDRLHR